MRPSWYWLWLNSFEGMHSRLLNCWPEDPHATLEQLDTIGWLNPRRRVALETSLQIEFGLREEERCDRCGVSVLTPDSLGYDTLFQTLDEPPMALYVKGRLPESGVGIVGTRRCSDYGKRCAYNLGYQLSQSGVVVYSGGASGIDGHAHSGAIEGGGVTVAVLGTGVDRVWPPDHGDLFETILEKGGALVSEYPLGTPGRPWRFPRRNRLIVAFSSRVVVVESPHKGGSMITGRLAMEMGHEVWAVLGRIDEGVCEGSNQLIADGAFPLVSIDDFVSAVTGVEQKSLFELPSLLSDDEQKIMNALKRVGDRTVDSLSLECKMDGQAVLLCLANLELSGLVQSVNGSRWRRAR